jgi:arylsulfatase A-like enzyme
MENCEYKRLGYTRLNYLGQAKCVLRLVDRFLAKLKKAGVYDNSLIFVMGDHGVNQEKVGIYYEKNPGQWQLEDEDNMLMKIKQVAMPLLLVKKFAAAQPEMNVSDAPAVIADIPRTVFSEIGVKNDAPGFSLFELRESQLRRRPFYAVSKVLRARQVKKYLVDGFSWLSSSWLKQNSGEDVFLSDD